MKNILTLITILFTTIVFSQNFLNLHYNQRSIGEFSHKAYKENVLGQINISYNDTTDVTIATSIQYLDKPHYVTKITQESYSDDLYATIYQTTKENPTTKISEEYSQYDIFTSDEDKKVIIFKVWSNMEFNKVNVEVIANKKTKYFYYCDYYQGLDIDDNPITIKLIK